MSWRHFWRRAELIESALRAHVAGAPLPPTMNPLALAGELNVCCALVDRSIDQMPDRSTSPVFPGGGSGAETDYHAVRQQPPRVHAPRNFP